MEKIFFSKPEIKLIKKNLKKLQRKMKIKLKFDKEGNVLINLRNDRVKEFLVRDVLEAIGYGFNFEKAFSIIKGNILEKINIKDLVKPSRIKTIKARIIGKKGKAKKNIEKLSNTKIIIKDHNVAILGESGNVLVAKEALLKLIKGSPHGKVYKFILRQNKNLEKIKEDVKEEFGI